MQTAAQSWLVYDLSMHSSFFLGLDQFLGQIPIVLLSLLGGVFADRHDRRRVLLMSQYLQMTCAFLLATLVFTGVVHVWHILCLSFVVGVAQSFGGPAYSALVPSLVPREQLQNAIALNSIQFNLARVIGPALGGIALIKLGAAWNFTFNGISFVAVIITLYMIQTTFVPAKSREPIMTSMKEGIRFMRQQPGMESLIVLAFLMTTLGFPLIGFLVVFAEDVFHGGTQTFTLLLSCSGAGAVTGALIVAGIGRLKRQGRSALFMLAMLGVFTMAFAQSPSAPVACAMLFLAGASLMAVFSMITTLVQTIIPDNMRGRVMSVYNLALRGGGPVGSLLVGTVMIPHFHAPVTFTIAGALQILLAVYFLTVNRRVAEL
ncbi:MAG: major facilitator superfamily 1 [Bryobacterales bacterium]|nr:major facilitator superfamily 1 [Bryobacterales bacterium]